MDEKPHKPSPLREVDPAARERMQAAIRAQRREQEQRAAELPAIRLEGEAALHRLLKVAKSDTGQSLVVARFLLSLYNGDRFPFDLTDFRRLDCQLFDDCIAVLKMDSQPLKEVHEYFENGGAIWEQLATDWGFTDYKDGSSWR